MTEQDIEKLITYAIDTMPVPWEKLWTIFQKIIQLTQQKNENNIIQENNSNKPTTMGEEE